MSTPLAASKSGARPPSAAAAPAAVPTLKSTQTRLIAAGSAGVIAVGSMIGFLSSAAAGVHVDDVFSVKTLVLLGISLIAVIVAATQASAIAHGRGLSRLLGHVALGSALLAVLVAIIIATQRGPMPTTFTCFMGWLCLASGLAAYPMGFEARRSKRRETLGWAECTGAAVVGPMTAAALCLGVAIMLWFQRVFS